MTDGPTISVVVRTKDRPALLAEALASLAEGTYRRAEVVVVNDGGAPPELPEDFPLPLRRVDLAEDLGRAEAANAGVAAATGEWIAFLDDDDLAAPEHLAVLAGAASAAGVRAVYSDAAVVTYELADSSGADGAGGWREVERRLPYSRDFDPDLLLVDNYIPFNTILFERSLLDELDRVPAKAGTGPADSGPFDPSLPIFEDWDFLIRLAARTPFHHVRRVTCEYRHFRGAGHHALGDRPRERADFLSLKARVIAKHREHLPPERLARVVDRLRAEAVEAAEAAAATAAAARRDRERGRKSSGARPRTGTTGSTVSSRTCAGSSARCGPARPSATPSSSGSTARRRGCARRSPTRTSTCGGPTPRSSAWAASWTSSGGRRCRA